MNWKDASFVPSQYCPVGKVIPETTNVGKEENKENGGVNGSPLSDTNSAFTEDINKTNKKRKIFSFPKYLDIPKIEPPWDYCGIGKYFPSTCVLDV